MVVIGLWFVSLLFGVWFFFLVVVDVVVGCVEVFFKVVSCCILVRFCLICVRCDLSLWIVCWVVINFLLSCFIFVCFCVFVVEMCSVFLFVVLVGIEGG